MTKNMFWKIGGYDEDFRGNYGCDLPFRYRLDQIYKCAHEHFSKNYIEAFFGGSDDHGLTRDATENRKLLEEKIKSNTIKPKSFIRFKWKQVK